MTNAWTRMPDVETDAALVFLHLLRFEEFAVSEWYRNIYPFTAGFIGPKTPLTVIYSGSMRSYHNDVYSL